MLFLLSVFCEMMMKMCVGGCQCVQLTVTEKLENLEPVFGVEKADICIRTLIEMTLFLLLVAFKPLLVANLHQQR